MSRATSQRTKSVVECFFSTVLNLIVGFCLAVLVWTIIIRPYGKYLPITIDNDLPGAVFCAILAVSYATFLKVRVRMVLFLPTMLGNAAQNYLLVVLFISLSKGPMQSVAMNAIESARVIGCTLTVTFELAKERAKLILNPIVEILKGNNDTDIKQIKQELGQIQNLVANIADFNQTRSIVDGTRQTKRVRTKAPRVQKVKFPETLNKSPEELVQIVEDLFQNASLELDPANFGVKVGLNAQDFQELIDAGARTRMNKLNLTDVMYQNCLDIFRGAKSSCDAAAEDIRQSCQDTIGPYFAAIWCSPVTFTLGTSCPWIIGEIVNEDSLCRQFVRSLSGVKLSGRVVNINDVYKNLTQQVQSLGANFKSNETDEIDRLSNRRLELSVTLNEKVRNVFLRTKDLLDFITNKYRLRRALLTAFDFVYELYTSYTFILISIQACKYHRSYLNKIQFDNHYITKQFVEYDRVKRLKGKPNILPLKKAEAETYITTFTCRRRTQEERKTQRSSCAGIALLIILTLSIIYMDSIFYSLLVSVHEHAYVRYRQAGRHKLNVKVIGDGSIARLVRNLTSKLSSVYDLNQLASTKRCLPDARATSYRFYLEYIYLVLIYLGIDQLSIFAMRLRRVICAFFHPEKEKLRVQYLHRYLVYQRRSDDDMGLTSFVGDSNEDEDDSVYTVRDAFRYLKSCVRDSICCRSCRYDLFRCS